MFILIFAAILLLLVLIHEWGHFMAARKSGVRVEEFGFGLPPRLWGKKFGKAPEKGEDDRTLYSINWLPLGGFVRMTGEDSTVVDKGDSKSFQNAPLKNRILITVAGVFMNFLLGIALFSLVYSIMGIPKPYVLIEKVAENSPASQSGIQSGDQITKINNQDIISYEQVSLIIKDKKDQNIKITLKRDNQEVTVNTTPRKNPPAGEGALGITMQQKLDTLWYPSWQMPFRGAWQGVQDTWFLAKNIVPSLGSVASSVAMSGEVPEGVAGPVGLLDLTKDITKLGIIPTLQFTALLSINLAVFNLLPIPALDGGRLIFLIFEAITGRRANQKLEQWTHTIGFALLLLLIIFITYNDIRKVFFS